MRSLIRLLFVFFILSSEFIPKARLTEWKDFIDEANGGRRLNNIPVLLRRKTLFATSAPHDEHWGTEVFANQS